MPSAPDWEIRKDDDGHWTAAGPVNLTVLDGGRCFKRRSMKMELGGSPGRRYLGPALAAIRDAAVVVARDEKRTDEALQSAWQRLIPSTTPENVLVALGEVCDLLIAEEERRQIESHTTVLVGELNGVRVYCDGAGQLLMTTQDLNP